MQVIADLQIHSKYAMATSRDSDLEHFAQGALRKGLGLLGTGDFTHPAWFEELKAKLTPVPGTGLFTYRGMTWMLSGEVSTIYEEEGKTRKVHHLLYAQDFESVARINEALSQYGNLASDGRPILKGLTSPELAEILSGISDSIVLIPAHAWTPWFSALGGKSGFDSIQDCYKDQVSRIFAIETGLSSDPPMNWRLSSLDRFALVSNSDAHSANPWRLGREANVFDLPRLTYGEVFDAIRTRSRDRFLFTVEVDPGYGKYHFSGHRRCGVSLSPSESVKAGGKCPKCGKKLTAGVLQRVEELADRPDGFVPPSAIPFKRLLPLYEAISFSTGVNRLYAKAVIEEQDKLIASFGNEFQVLLYATEAELSRVTKPATARAIVASREGGVSVTPGYDGNYGVPVFPGVPSSH